MSQQIFEECSICLENIESSTNKVVTECGHSFHCSCIMKNVAYNGFGCPYCRNVLAEECDETEDDDDNSNTDTYTDTDTDTDSEDENYALPTAEYIIEKLKDNNVTYEDLIKHILYNCSFTEFDENVTTYNIYVEENNKLVDNMVDIILNYRLPLAEPADNIPEEALI